MVFPTSFYEHLLLSWIKGRKGKGDHMTNTDICNMALSFLSKGKISSIDDNVEEAKQCKIHYEHCRKILLRQYPWGFAKRTVKLALLADEFVCKVSL